MIWKWNNNQRTTFLSVDQVHSLANHCAEPARAAVWIALLTGDRRGEIMAMQPHDINADTITIHARNTKTRKSRVVSIVPALRPWLAHLPIAYTHYEGLKTAFQRARKAADIGTSTSMICAIVVPASSSPPVPTSTP